MVGQRGSRSRPHVPDRGRCRLLGWRELSNTLGVNLFSIQLDEAREGGPTPFRRRHAQLGRRLGASMLGGTLYGLAPGQRVCPYHYEYGNEEWLIVLSGRPTLRTPEGEWELIEGDVVCFPEGPSGAHAVSNRGAETSRVLILSTKHKPAVFVYPDSAKIAIVTPEGGESGIFRTADAVDYWDGEDSGKR